jgi:clan AA aspartic protease
MGLLEVTLILANPAAQERATSVKLLVDTGATLSWIPRGVLEGIGLRPQARRAFLLADGRRVERETAVATLILNGVAIGTTVVFGEPGDGTMLGVSALEELGLAIDPVERKLVPRDLLAL